MGYPQRDGNRNGGFRNGNGGSKPSFQKRSGGDDRGEKVMHKATCSECGKACEVPFRPSSDKPVYCSDCFSTKRNETTDRAPRVDYRAGKRDFNDRPVPRHDFKPSPVNDDVKKQLIEINTKLDRLLTAMLKTTEVKEVKEVKKAPAKTVVKKIAVKKVIKKKK